MSAWNGIPTTSVYPYFREIFSLLDIKSYELLSLENPTSKWNWIFRVHISFSSRLGSRFGFPVAKLVRYKRSLIFKLAVFRLSHVHVHGGACLNNEKVVTSAQAVKKRALFFSHTYLLRLRLTSNHGVPIGNPHSGVLVTKSAFTYARKKIHSGGPRNTKCSSSTSKCLSVWAKNILGSSLMMAHDGHMRQTAYRYVRHGAELNEHPNTP